MNPINNKNTTKPPISPCAQNNAGGSNPTVPSVSQVNNAASRPEDMEHAASQPQIPDRHFTRLMPNPEATFTQKDLDTIAEITDLKKKEQVLEAIVHHLNVAEDIRTAAKKLLQDVQEDLIYNKEYTSQNIWEAYTDAQKIRSLEKQTDFLKRVLQSQIDMKAFPWRQFPNFQDLIKGFAEPIQQDLYCLIVNTDKCPFQLRILALRQIELSLEEKEAYLSSIREQLSKPEVLTREIDLQDLKFCLQDFPKTTQNEVFIHIAHNACFTHVRLKALQLLDMPSAELKTICFDFWSNNWWEIKSIQDFPESIRQDLCRSIMDSTLSLESRISALRGSDLTSDEKEAYLSDMLRKPLEKDQLKFLLRNLKFFPQSIQCKCYMQIAESDYSYKVRFKALQLLDMSSAEQKAFCCRGFSEDFCQRMSGKFESYYFLDFLRSCSADFRLELCAQIAKYESLLSPFRMEIVEWMEAGPVKDEALSVMVGSDFFKLEDKIKLAKLINDSSKKLKTLEDLLVKAPYAHFEYMDKYEEKGEALKQAFNCQASLVLRLKTVETSPVPDLKYRILEQFFKSCTVDGVRLIQLVGDLFIELNQDEKHLIISNFPKNERSNILKLFFEKSYAAMGHFPGILDMFFEEGTPEERQLIMLNFSKMILYYNLSHIIAWERFAWERFERFYKNADFDQETKKTFVMNLLLNQCHVIPSDYRRRKDNSRVSFPETYLKFCRPVLDFYLEEFPEEREAPVGGILEAIALNATIPVKWRQNILSTEVTDKRVKQDLLLLTEGDHIMETRFKKMKLSALNNSDE